MKKIKVQSKISYPVFILLVLIGIALCAGVVYILFFCEFASSRTKGDGSALLSMIVFMFPIFFKSLLSKETYLSELLVFDDYIELVYKKQNKIVTTKKIFKSEIQKFSLNAGLVTQRVGKGTICICTSSTSIKLKNDKDVCFNQNSTAQLFGCPYQYILDVLSVSKDIPNFNLNLHGDNEYARADIDYYRRFGRKMPFMVGFKYSMKKTPMFVKIILGFCTLTFIGSMGMLIFINLPSLPLTDAEKEYMVYYNKASDSRIKNKDYNGAIKALKEAQKLVSDNPELYRELGYNYQNLKDYQSASDIANEGLKYVNNTNSAYRKYHNFKFIGKEDISLYSIIAKSERKLNNYSKAIEAYSYIIEHSHYTYDDSYFWRGYCYYYNGDIKSAHEDFIKYREIILKYFKDQQETEYKDEYPRFNQDNLDNIEKWISATK